MSTKQTIRATLKRGYQTALTEIDKAVDAIGVGAGLAVDDRMKVLRDRKALMRVKRMMLGQK
jgi:hypothetical protein